MVSIHGHSNARMERADMPNFFDNKPFRDLKSLAAYRAQARELEDRGVQGTTLQLLRFGVCPCIAMGRYSTCCGPKHGDLSK
jgi:hypothetical protein